jgi:2-C-methyl-D-erythritol 4-phosphate cytidylyltransferase
MSQDLAVILLAGGHGARLGWEIPKQFIRLAGKTILEHSVDQLRKAYPLAKFVVTAPSEYLIQARNCFAEHNNLSVIPGGDTRQGSVFSALQSLHGEKPEFVIIHDAARPFVSESVLHAVEDAVRRYDAVDVAIEATDTIIVENEGFIQSIPNRKTIWRGQTPQAFRYEKLWQAYQKVGFENIGKYTDDCGIFLAADPFAKIKIVPGASDNIKITDEVDLVLADELFRLKMSINDPNIKGVNLRHKICAVFGATSGIGHAIAEILTEAGCRVYRASRSTGVDITDYRKVNQFIKDIEAGSSTLDFVVNTAGILKRNSLVIQTQEELVDQINTNFLGALNVAKASHSALKKSNGMLLNFSSSSYTRGRSEYVAYSASKAAIVNMTQGLAEEWAEDNIRVNCIVPGRTDTLMRRNNFYKEDQASLLSPFEVALVASKVMGMQASGCIVRV